MYAIRCIPPQTYRDEEARDGRADRILMLCYPRPDEHPDFRITGLTGPYTTWDDVADAVAAVLELEDEQARWTRWVLEVVDVADLPEVPGSTEFTVKPL